MANPSVAGVLPALRVPRWSLGGRRSATRRRGSPNARARRPRWRTGEYIRDRFTITIPSNWQGNGLAIGLVASDPHGGKAAATGAAPANDPNLLVLGVLLLGSQPLPTP